MFWDLDWELCSWITVVNLLLWEVQTSDYREGRKLNSFQISISLLGLSWTGFDIEMNWCGEEIVEAVFFFKKVKWNWVSFFEYKPSFLTAMLYKRWDEWSNLYTLVKREKIYGLSHQSLLIIQPQTLLRFHLLTVLKSLTISLLRKCREKGSSHFG